MDHANSGASTFQVFDQPMMSQRTRRRVLTSWRNPDLLIDVGANTGQYGSAMREIGFRNRIVSFEPMSSEFAVLEHRAARDALWECRRLALGAEHARSQMLLAADSVSSSLLAFEPAQLARYAQPSPSELASGSEVVEVVPLDSIWRDVVGTAIRPYIKVDVQGFELEVLRGAQHALAHIDVVEVEVSFVQLYRGGPSFLEVATYLSRLGFEVRSMEGHFEDARTGEMLQADAIFVRSSA